MDMREMTLSKEVYDKKPGKFFTVFIFGLLCLVVTALAWAYLGHIDIVVRAHGIIRPNAQTVMVTNATGGEVRGVFFYEGQQVSRGDILYIVDTFHLENERLLMLGQLDLLSFNIATLELFRDSIETGENLINSFNYEHSARFDNFLISIDAIEHGANNHMTFLQEDMRGYRDSLSYARFELTTLRAFENSITQGEDMFGAINGGSNGRNREVLNTLHNQYLQYILEMEHLGFQVESTTETLYGYQLIRDSVSSQQNFFDYQPDHSTFIIYRRIYDEFVLQLGQHEESYKQAYEQYTTYKALYEAGLVPLVDLQNAVIRLDNVQVLSKEFTSGFLLEIEGHIRTAENRLVQLNNQIDLLRVGNLANISTQMLRLEDAINDMESGLSQAELQQGSLFTVDNQAGDAAMLRLDELNRTLGQISALEHEAVQLALNLTGIDAQIENAIVRAPADGEIMVHTELSEGGFVLGGVQVLSIVPTRGDMLTANIFVSNNDIGRISESMTVRFDIAAMPRRDFGDITGYVTRIAADIGGDPGAPGYFQVESEIEDKLYYSVQGEGAMLRVGMAFEARIVVERQRILFFLLDRLNLMVN